MWSAEAGLGLRRSGPLPTPGSASAPALGELVELCTPESRTCCWEPRVGQVLGVCPDSSQGSGVRAAVCSLAFHQEAGLGIVAYVEGEEPL